MVSGRNQVAVDGIVGVIDVLVASRKLHTYCVGITKDAKLRSYQYKKYSVPKPWPHMVFLAFDLDQAKALAFERAVFEACTGGDKRSALYAKYASDLRTKGYRASVGGAKFDPNARYCLYICWCNED